MMDSLNDESSSGRLNYIRSGVQTSPSAGVRSLRQDALVNNSFYCQVQRHFSRQNLVRMLILIRDCSIESKYCIRL